MTTEVGSDVRPEPPAPHGPPGSHGFRTPAWWRGVREILLIFVLWLCYSAGRNLADQDEVSAHARALGILHAEQVFHLDFELWLNNATHDVAWLSILMCFWYAALHYTITPAVLAFVYIRHRDDYSRVRNALVLACMVALVCYIFFPTEPPRLSGLGYHDTMAQYASYGWWTEHASAPAGMQGLTNELAAMPSLHVGWTVWVAWALRRHLNRAGRVLTWFYVAGTSFVVFATANHWLLDVVAGIALVLGAIYTVNRVAPLRRDDGVVQLVRTAWSRVRRTPSTPRTP